MDYDENCDTKIKFYSLGSEKVELIKRYNDGTLNIDKKVFSSPDFDKALIKVVEKDIDSLNVKTNKIVSEIKTKLSELGINNENIEYGIEEINNILNYVNKLLTELPEYKKDNKVSIFSSDKKNKKRKLKLIDNLIEYLSKIKIEIISMNNEYIKLSERKNNLSPKENLAFDDELEENPLERTINFYMNQKEKVIS